MHENFKNLLSDDIALLKLRDPITWSRLVQPVCLPNAKLTPSVGTLCWAIVWGQPNMKGEWWQAVSKTLTSLECNFTTGSFTPSFTHSLGQQTFPEHLHVLHTLLTSVGIRSALVWKTHVASMDLGSQS